MINLENKFNEIDIGEFSIFEKSKSRIILI